MRKSRILLIAASAIILIAATFMALIDPEIDRYFLGAGGQSTGGSYVLTGSIGQHDAGEELAGGSYKITGGFLASEPGAVFPIIFIPLVTK